jgi:hypothetical protein
MLKLRSSNATRLLSFNCDCILRTNCLGVKEKKMKITEEIINQMKEFRQQGMSYDEISRRLKVSTVSVQYHLDKEQKEKRKKSSLEYYHNLPKEKKELRNKKVREYLFKRYNEDEEFRKRKKEYQRNYEEKRYEKLGIQRPT